MLSRGANKKIWTLLLDSAVLWEVFLPPGDTHIYLSYSSMALFVPYRNFLSLILSSIVIPTLYTEFNRFFQRHKGIFDGRVVSLTNNENRSAVYFLKNLLNSSKSESDE